MVRDRLNIGINPGRLRTLLTLLEETPTLDASGAGITYAAAVPPTTAYAEVGFASGAEVIRMGLDVSLQYFRVTLRYNPAFTAKKHIQTPNGSEYIIQAIENVKERNAYLILMCLGVGSNT